MFSLAEQLSDYQEGLWRGVTHCYTLDSVIYLLRDCQELHE
jgi:hypothetical protein